MPVKPTPPETLKNAVGMILASIESQTVDFEELEKEEDMEIDEYPWRWDAEVYQLAEYIRTLQEELEAKDEEIARLNFLLEDMASRINSRQINYG